MERLRTLLRERVSPPLRVSDQRTQYWFDEDSAAYCEIDVRDPTADGAGFVVVVTAASASPGRDAFVARVWHRYVADVWVVGTEKITRMAWEAGSVVLGPDQTLTSPSLPGVEIQVRAVYAPSP